MTSTHRTSRDGRRLVLAAFAASVIGCAPGPDVAQQEPAATEQPTAELASAAVRAVLTSTAFLDALDQLEQSFGDDPLSQPRLAVGAVSESSNGATTTVRLRVDAAPAFTFPASYAPVGVVEASVTAGVLEAVAYVDGGELPNALPLPPPVATLFGDAAYRQRLRSLAAGDQNLSIVGVAEASDAVGAAVVVDMLGNSPDSESTAYELVARFAEQPEHALGPESVAVYADGVIADVRAVDWVQGWQAFPGNGYFAYDDAAALQAFWSGFSAIAPAPLPFLGPNEVIVGISTHYFPYTAKDMSIDAVRDTGAEVAVDVTVTWNGFGCYEHTGQVDLFDLVKVPSGGRPIVVNVYTDTGEPCDTGVTLPDLPPKLVHELRIEPATHNVMTLCDSTGNFNDPPFAAGCQAQDSLPR